MAASQKKDEAKADKDRTRYNLEVEKTNERFSIFATEEEWSDLKSQYLLTHSSYFSVTAREIGSKVSQVDYDELETAVGVYATQIQQNANSISLIADYEDLEDARNVRRSLFKINADAITSEVTRATAAEGTLSGRITTEAGRITAEVTRATGAEETLAGRLTITENAITQEVTDRTNADTTLSGRITTEAGKISQIVTAVGANGEVTTASIVTAINNGGSEILLDAGKIRLTGQVTLDSKMGVDANGYILLKGTTIVQMEFVHTARELQIHTIQKCVGFPKRYTFYVSQPIAACATRIHEYVKCANSVYPLNQHEAQIRRDYGRYMDDGYIIYHNKEFLVALLQLIRGICTELGITLNDKKTQIVKLSHGFTFLKIRYYLLPSGKIIKKLARTSIVRMRRKMKKFTGMLKTGKMTGADLYQSFQSWRAYASNFNAYQSIRSMAKLYNKLFIFAPDFI